MGLSRYLGIGVVTTRMREERPRRNCPQAMVKRRQDANKIEIRMGRRLAMSQFGEEQGIAYYGVQQILRKNHFVDMQEQMPRQLGPAVSHHIFARPSRKGSNMIEVEVYERNGETQHITIRFIEGYADRRLKGTTVTEATVREIVVRDFRMLSRVIEHFMGAGTRRRRV